MDCKLKVLIYHHTAEQILSYCFDIPYILAIALIPYIVRWYGS
jgi:hypothetical protein